MPKYTPGLTVSSVPTNWTNTSACSEYTHIHARSISFMTGRDHLENIGVGGNVILEWILRKQSRKLWTAFIWLRTETGAGLL